MKFKYLWVICIVCILPSCSKFLEEYSRDLKYVESATDLNKLMIGEAFLPSASYSISSQATLSTLTSEIGVLVPWLHVMDDDSEVFAVDIVDPSESTPLNILSAFHNWSQVPTANILNITWEDTFWRKVYKRIGALNGLIFQAENLAKTNPTDSTVKQLRGEALFLRAYYYFLLQNIYGAPYRVSTANVDEGVPMKISEKIEDRYFQRDNNETVYAQIIADLNEAAILLEGYQPDTKLRVGIATVRALQSRVYLYTEQYEKVLEVTEGFEQYGYQLQDLNAHVANTNFTFRSAPETIFTMGPNTVPAVFLSDSVSAWSGNDNRASSFKVSDELVNLYEANDLRGDVFYRRAAKSRSWLPGKYRTFATYNDPAQVSCTFSFRYAEIVLNRAEAYAMQGSDIAASNEIQKLRTKRLSSGSSQGVPTSNEALVQFIRDERRRELSFEGHRWFDLRRYAVNSKFPLPSTFTIKHPAYAYDSQTNSHNLIGNYVLNAVSQDASAWQVPIPNYAIEFNRGNLTNLIRPVRNVQPL